MLLGWKAELSSGSVVYFSHTVDLSKRTSGCWDAAPSES